MNILNDNIWKLLTGLQQGDAEAFGKIYHLYVDKLYRYARRTLSDIDECEEIVQDVFASLWQQRENIGHVTALEPYLFSMVKYKIIHFLRRSKVKQKYAMDYKMFQAMYYSSALEHDDHGEISRMIDRGLAKLPERCRYAVNLRLKENLSNDEIAERMDIKKSTVENYFVTAVKHLREFCKGRVSEP